MLTAAHCINDDYYLELDVVVGNNNALSSDDDYDESRSERRSVKQRVIHPEYNWKTFEYDFAIVLLDRPIQHAINETTTHLVTLNQNNSYPPPTTTTNETTTTAQILGWGTTGHNYYPTALQMANVTVIPNEICSMANDTNGRSYDGLIFESMICTDSDEGKDSCQGDSGGPVIIPQQQQQQRHDDSDVNDDVVVTDVQIGVISWGFGCAKFPGVDGRVSMAYDWIQRIACGLSSDTSGSSLCQDDHEDVAATSLEEEEQLSSSLSPSSSYQPTHQLTESLSFIATPTTAPLVANDGHDGHHSNSITSPTVVGTTSSSPTPSSSSSSTTLSVTSIVPTFEEPRTAGQEDQSSPSTDVSSSMTPTSISHSSVSPSLQPTHIPTTMTINTPTIDWSTTNNEEAKEESKHDTYRPSNSPSAFPTWVLPMMNAAVAND